MSSDSKHHSFLPGYCRSHLCFPLFFGPLLFRRKRTRERGAYSPFVEIWSVFFPATRRSVLACSRPTTGNFAGSSSPTCTSSEAWSHHTCSCATFPFLNLITTTCGSSTFFPVGGIPGSR